MNRFWEVDALRGVAIILMVIYHFLFDLNYFFGYGIDVFSGVWKIVQVTSASLFLFLVGVSLVLSHQRRSAHAWSYYVKRGATIFSWGLAITVVTYLFLGRSAVLFGILHLIGLSILLAYPFITRKWLALGVGLSIIALRSLVTHIPYEWLFWLGAPLATWTSVDYYPLVPWFSIVLIGIFVGNVAFEKNKRTYPLIDASRSFGSVQLQWLGRKSLIIYLVHQPILMSVLYVVTFFL